MTSIILLSVALFGSISVLGLLQSTEIVSTLDINIPIYSTPLTYSPPPPPPEPKTEFDVYLGPYKSTESVNTLDINIPIYSTPSTHHPPINIPIYSTPSTHPPPPPPPEPKTVFSIHGDSNCTKTISDIKWGPIEVGGQVSKTIYVKNSGYQSITLSLYVENWDPVESSDYMNLSWDYDGSSVEPGSTIEVTLTLKVDSTTPEIEKFSFQILIIGTSS